MTRKMPHPTAELLAEVAHQASGPVPEECTGLVDALRARFGSALGAVLLYGSHLHAETGARGIVDLFAVVDSYEDAYPGFVLRAFNALLPPNLFFLAVGEGDGRVHAKYSVLSRSHLDRGTSRWFHSYVWARLAQPCRILWARDDGTVKGVHLALAHAVLTFHSEVVPTLAGDAVDAASIWREGLARTYASELRPEGGERAEWLVERNREDYRDLTTAVGAVMRDRLEPSDGGGYRAVGTEADRRRARARWLVRRWQGKVLSVLRLGKSALTFAGAAEYVTSKIERHTGVSVPVTRFMRRHPFISAPYALVSFLARRVIR